MAEQLNTERVRTATRGILSRFYTSPYELPVNEHKYGQLPSCKGTHDGSYQYPQEEHRCDAYFTCQNGNAKGIKCPGTQLFDVNTGSCQEGKNIDCYI